MLRIIGYEWQEFFGERFTRQIQIWRISFRVCIRFSFLDLQDA